MLIHLPCSALLVFLLAFLAALNASAQTLEGRVVAITDGDTFTLLTADNTELKIRVAEIDAPERGQPYGTKSKQALADFIFGKTVQVEVQVVDRYGRYVGRPLVDELDVTAAMVRIGGAWVYRSYSKDAALYELEDLARKNQVGIWSLAEYQRVAPWDWRNGEQNSSQEKADLDDYRCGAKSYCREMVSCDEAKYHLRQCGLASLDGDGDGTPCEAICR